MQFNANGFGLKQSSWSAREKTRLWQIMYNSMCVFHWPIHMICILYVCYRAGDWRHIGSQHAEKTIQKIFAKFDFWWKCDFKHFQRFPQKTCQRFQTFQNISQKHFPKNTVFKHFKFHEIWCHFWFSLTAVCKPLNFIFYMFVHSY